MNTNFDYLQFYNEIFFVNTIFTFNPIWTRQNFLINGPGGDRSTQHIQTLITPELHKIKIPFLLHKKLNFPTKSLYFLPLSLQHWSLSNFNISQELSEAIGSLFICIMLISIWLPWRGITAGVLFSNSEIILKIISIVLKYLNYQFVAWINCKLNICYCSSSFC